MDIGLKGAMDGIEAAEQIRAQHDIPIIFLTAYANQSTLERARLVEPAGYAIKPFDERELISNIEIACYKHAIERKLRENEARYRVLIETSPDTIGLYDLQQDCLTTVNQQFLRQHRYDSLEALQARRGIEFVVEEDRERIEQHITEVLTSVTSRTFEITALRQDGSTFPAEFNIAALHDAHGNPSALVFISRDITERKQSEQALRESQLRLQSFERDQRRLAEALRDTAMALNSSLKLDDVLDHILDHIGAIVEYDALTVFLFEDQHIRSVRYRTAHEQALDPHATLRITLADVPMMQALRDSRQPHILADTQIDPRWKHIVGMERVRSLLSAPFDIRGHVAGAITLASTTPNFFTPNHAERLMAFASQAAVAIDNAQLYEQAQHLSVTDPLTELQNRRAFFESARLEFERHRRYGGALAIILADIDHFKRLNDTYGHAAGDRALHEVAQRIKQTIRTVDSAARYGGEEFVILMPATSAHAALDVAERLRLIIAETPITSTDQTFTLTISLGIAEADPTCRDLDDLLKRADQAMYAAKEAGRNRTKLYARHG